MKLEKNNHALPLSTHNFFQRQADRSRGHVGRFFFSVILNFKINRPIYIKSERIDGLVLTAYDCPPRLEQNLPSLSGMALKATTTLSRGSSRKEENRLLEY